MHDSSPHRTVEGAVGPVHSHEALVSQFCRRMGAPTLVFGVDMVAWGGGDPVRVHHERYRRLQRVIEAGARGSDDATQRSTKMARRPRWALLRRSRGCRCVWGGASAINNARRPGIQRQRGTPAKSQGAFQTCGPLSANRGWSRRAVP